MRTVKVASPMNAATKLSVTSLEYEEPVRVVLLRSFLNPKFYLALTEDFVGAKSNKSKRGERFLTSTSAQETAQ